MFGDELSERKRLILNAIIEAHIEGGEPVGSKFLVQNKQIACSSATIRNEMAELEELGYLEQPHTSAGRVPSELGYRFYVDQLARSYAVTTHEIEEINRLLKVKMTEIDQILSTASKVASVLTNYTGIAVKQKSSQLSIKRFEGFIADDTAADFTAGSLVHNIQICKLFPDHGSRYFRPVLHHHNFNIGIGLIPQADQRLTQHIRATAGSYNH